LNEDGPDPQDEPTQGELFGASTLAESDAQRRRDLAASLTAALFGAIDEASTDTEAQDTSNE
jgi:hypothetical protein